MKRLEMMLAKVLPLLRNARNARPNVGVVLTAVLIVALAISGGAATLGFSIFRLFTDDSGKIQSAPSAVTISTSSGQIVEVNTALDATNTFFIPNFGTTGNGQSCATCHQPDQGFTINVERIQAAFAASNGTDPLFRPNDTANDPNIPLSSHSAADYSLMLHTGIVRIGKTFPSGGSDFTAVAADQATITKFGGPFPLGAGTNPVDPQQGVGHQTLSVFRRPLVNTNVHLDSSVLWDGRASIGNMRAQVIGAAKTLLLVPSPTNEQADQVAAFMLGVYTDQVFDSAAGEDADGCALTSPQGAQCGAGLLTADGAAGGVDNLLGLALGSSVPCNTPDTANLLQTACVPNDPGYDIFDAWKNLPSDAGTNAGRLAVARGQEIFNSAELIVPVGGIAGLSADAGDTIHCSSCHAKRNVGNNPDATLFARIGTDAVSIVQALATAHPESSGLQEMLARVRALPQYCLRPTSSTSTAPCGSGPGDVITTDPGHAMVSGHIADVGEFKPPILRGLSSRSPYFHAGVAESIDALVDFYNARFSIGLTADEHRDLVAFLEAQ